MLSKHFLTMYIGIFWCSIFCFTYFTHVTSGPTITCNTGWFGSSCQYKCHCTNNNCNDQGLCLAGSSCERGWFGPLCQYQDLATVGAKVTPANSLVDDGDDDTCTNLKTLTITWDKAYQITWLRLSLNDTGVISNTTITIKITNFTGADVDITFFSMITVTSRVKDILLRSSFQAIKVTLTFLRTVTVCSLNINGGRNVALHQKTWQSTNHNESGVIYDSSKAVDGNPSNDFYGQGSCSHTLGVNGRWGIKFAREHTVNRFVLYNRGDNQERLRGFNLVAYNKNNQLELNYTDDSRQNASVYNITTTTLAVQSVNITVKTYLTLCEVEIFGDIECGGNTFGLECAKICNCNDPTETCFVATGGCRSGCAAGYQGEGCLEACDPTFYGLNCQDKCPEICEGQLCNTFNGDCLSCPPGKTGASCLPCDASFYGNNCTQKCSVNCTDQLCDNVDGVCFNCPIGTMGPACDQSCPKYTYGLRCNLTCSATCLGSMCHAVTGHCLTCVDGFQGDFCDSEDRLSQGMSIGIGIGIGVMCCVFIIGLTVVIIVRRLTSASSRSTEDNQHNESHLSSSGEAGFEEPYDGANLEPQYETKHIYENKVCDPYESFSNVYNEVPSTQYESVVTDTVD